jgi:lysozyme
MKPTKKVVAKSVMAAGITAAVISAVVPFTKAWEGSDLVAKRDMIGTGHPLTYCHGATAVDGSVRPGQRFTPAQCDALLAKSLPKYLHPLQACIKVQAPIKVMAAALDAAYNAGPIAVCHSQIVTRINAGDFAGACNAFKGWYVRASGQVVRGLINRRNAEKMLCLEGVSEGIPKSTKPMPWWQHAARTVLFWRA